MVALREHQEQYPQTPNQNLILDANMKYYHKYSRRDTSLPQIKDDPQNFTTVEQKEHKETLKKLIHGTDALPERNTSSVSSVKEEPTTRAVEVRRHVRQGSCNWCKKQTILLDFSSYYEGREIYCTGLCSDECFGEAAKQIVSVESGSSKPRYIGGSGDDCDESGVDEKSISSQCSSQRTPNQQYTSSLSLSSSISKDSMSVVMSSSVLENSLLSLGAATKSNENEYGFDQAKSNDRVEMFINKECDCGPYLDPTKIAEAMKETYRGNIQMLLKTIYEDILRSAFHSKTVFGFLKPGLGQCTVSTVFNNSRLECRLDAAQDDQGMFWHVLSNFTENLRCCPNFFSLVKHKRGCGRCRSLSDRISPEIPMHWSKPATQNVHSGEQDLKFKFSDEAILRLAEAEPLYNNTKQRTDVCYQRRGYANMRQSFETEQMETEQQYYRDYYSYNRHVKEELSLPYTTHTYENENTRTDNNVLPLGGGWKFEAGGVEVTIAPRTWRIEEVVEFMEKTDLQPYVETFRENEIDGKALLLLEKDLIINHMAFKLGPAIKLLDIIDELRVVQNKI